MFLREANNIANRLPEQGVFRSEDLANCMALKSRDLLIQEYMRMLLSLALLILLIILRCSFRAVGCRTTIVHSVRVFIYCLSSFKLLSLCFFFYLEV
jgi:hypothetical protein